jgi:hypothetical protein
MILPFTCKSELELYNYKLDVKKKLLKNSNKFSELEIKIIKLFYKNQLIPSLYGCILYNYFSKDELDTLIKIYGNKFKLLYFNGSYLDTFETSCYGYPLTFVTTSYLNTIKRHFYYYLQNDNYVNECCDVLIILLSDFREIFFGQSDSEPTNANEQTEIIKKFFI